MQLLMEDYIHFVALDISGDSIEAAKQRYNSYKMKGNNKQLPFTADFYTMDCTKVLLHLGAI